MKIVYLSKYYNYYLDSFYTKHPGLSHSSFEEQVAAFTDDHFGVFGSYRKYAARAGNEAHLLVPNNEALQKKWAAENKVSYNEKNWMEEIVLAQLRTIQPDVLFLSSSFEFYSDFLDAARPFCKRVFSWISCPIPPGLKLNKLDLILSSLPDYVTNFREQGIHSELLSAAFDTELLSSFPAATKRDIDFSFIGGLSIHHTNRRELLEELARSTPIQLYGYGFRKKDLKGKVKNLISPDPLFNRYRSEAWGLEMYTVLRRSKITFNSHIDVALGNSVNMRMYEATGVGTLLLTDKNKSNLLNYFESGSEVIEYESTEDAIEKFKYFITNDAEREKIAKKGQQKTFEKYNMKDNVAQMLRYFENYL